MTFLDTSDLKNEEITLRLDHTFPGDSVRNWVPAYYFDILDATGQKVGICDLRIGHNEGLYYGGNIGYAVDEPFRGNHYAEKACRLLFELATEATFPDKEIETERGVVLDEIISYKDNPAEDVYDRFEELLFAGFPLQTPILGTTASVKKITPEMLRSFVREQFVPEKMVFTVVADIGEAKLEKQVLKIIDHVFSQSH